MKTEHSKQAQKQRLLYFFTGLTMALSISLIALEWGKRYQAKFEGGISELTNDPIEEELPPITLHKRELPKPTIQKTPQPIPDLVTEFIEVPNKTPDVFDPSELPDFELVDFGNIGYEDTIQEIKVPVFEYELSKQPVFPGGEKARLVYMRDNTAFPKIALDQGFEGIVFVEFTLDKNGFVDPNTIEIIRSPHPSMSREVVNAIKRMPQWEPGKQGEIKVPVRMRQQVKFQTR